MCYEQWALNTEGLVCHRVGRSQEMGETTVLSHISLYHFSLWMWCMEKRSLTGIVGLFVMLLYSSSFSKLLITFSNVNFFSAEQDTILKYFWVGRKTISLSSVWAGHPSLLVVFNFHNSATMSDIFLSHLSTKEFHPCGPSLGDWPWLWSIALDYPITCPGSILACLFGKS